MPTIRVRLASSVLAAAGMALLASPARADSIDGRWCAEDGRRMDIRGSTIVTPNGTTMSGDYDRHGFRYTIPANEPEAGTAITMSLRGETTVALWKGSVGGTPEIWKRCTPVS